MKPLYLALGDSLTTGYGVGLSKRFADLYFHWLATGTPHLSYVNLGVNGLTTANLAKLFQSNQQLRNLTTQASLITLTIGSNDFLHFAGQANLENPSNFFIFLRHFDVNLNRIGQSLRSLNTSSPIQIATLYNPLPAGPYQGYSEQAQALLARGNKALKHWSAGFGAILVPVDQAFRGQERIVIGSDRIHPNELGHAIMAKLFAAGHNW